MSFHFLYKRGGFIKIKIISIFVCLLLLIMIPVSAGSTIFKEIFQYEKQKNLNQEGFEAEIGMTGEEDPCVKLSGQYTKRGRYIIVSGTATSRDKQGPFQGVLRGSHFILQIPVRGRILNFVGRVSFNEDHTSFEGGWRIRGYRATGWIEGALNPRE